MANTYGNRRAKGLCGYCGKLPPHDNRTSCLGCYEKRKIRCREYYTGKRLIINKRARDSYSELPSRYWKKMQRNRLKIYGLTPADLIPLLELQEYSCAACFEALNVGEFHIDHNHATKIVRGILHAKCNRALGQVEDSPDKLRLLANYLESNTNVSECLV